jgi:hypothetical protein
VKILALAVLSAALPGCQSIPSDAPRASAALQPTKGSKTAGTVDFYEARGDGMSAKGHFNPFAKPHGHPQSGER